MKDTKVLRKTKKSLQISADETGEIVTRGAILLLLVVSLPKVLDLISTNYWGLMGLIATFTVFFCLCYVVAYKKEVVIVRKIINVAKMIPIKKIGAYH